MSTTPRTSGRGVVIYSTDKSRGLSQPYASERCEVQTNHVGKPTKILHSQAEHRGGMTASPRLPLTVRPKKLGISATAVRSRVVAKTVSEPVVFYTGTEQLSLF